MQEAEVGGANGNDASGNPADAAAQLLGPLFPAPSKKKRRFSMMQVASACVACCIRTNVILGKSSLHGSVVSLVNTVPCMRL